MADVTRVPSDHQAFLVPRLVRRLVRVLKVRFPIITLLAQHRTLGGGEADHRMLQAKEQVTRPMRQTPTPHLTS